MDLLLFTTFVLIGLAVLVVYVQRISSDLRIIRKLLAADMEHRVAPTLAKNKLAAAVEEAREPRPAGAAR